MFCSQTVKSRDGGKKEASRTVGQSGWGDGRVGQGSKVAR